MSMTIEEKKAKKAATSKAYKEANKEATKASNKAYKEANRERLAISRKTEAGKAIAAKSKKKFYATEAGKTMKARDDAKYVATEKGKATRNKAAAKYRSTEGGKSSGCIKAAQRRCSKLQRTPAWAKNDPRIKEVYRQAGLWGMEVDHYVPLQADLASGLHCWENLQLLHRSENASKSNTWIPC